MKLKTIFIYLSSIVLFSTSVSCRNDESESSLKNEQQLTKTNPIIIATNIETGKPYLLQYIEGDANNFLYSDDILIPKEDVNIIKIFQSPINNNEIKKLYNQLANHTTGKAKIESKGSRRIATVGVTIPGTRLWSNNTVNVSVSPDFSNEQKNNILTAIDIWHTNTSLNFNIVDVNDGTVQKVNIIPTASGCRSTTGMPSIHDGTIQLSPTCDIQSIIHEIGHTVGLIHEHQRPLRDTYLKNVLNEQDLSVIASAFSESLANSIRYNLEIEEVIDDLDPFDMHSVMLYGSWPRNNQELSDYLKYQYQKPFYTDANGQEVVRPTYGLTPNDIKKVHRIYGMAD